MSDSFDLDFKGLEDLERRMDEFGPELSRRALKKAVLAGASVLKDAAKGNAPVLTKGTDQRTPGQLRDSIDVVPDAQRTMDPSSESVTVSPTYNKSNGQQDPGVWGKFVEYGTAHSEAQPYLRPALDEHADEAIDHCIAALGTELEAMPEAPALAA